MSLPPHGRSAPEEHRAGREVASFVVVGTITAPVGLDGSVRVDPLSNVPQRFAPGASLYVNGALHKVQRLRSGRLHVVKLEGIDSREAAERLRGAEITVPEADSPPPPADTYYHFQLLDMQVVDVHGNLLGVITEILDYPANDVYVVTLEGRETLIPAVGDMVKAVDVAARRMVVDLPETV
ncbi:MAG: 16S rRNA processing protein RimM [Chloroflexi bacterium]|nr:16S rRNA processing protein RimM [Chloroflexota bacterium]